MVEQCGGLDRIVQLQLCTSDHISQQSVLLIEIFLPDDEQMVEDNQLGRQDQGEQAQGDQGAQGREEGYREELGKQQECHNWLQRPWLAGAECQQCYKLLTCTCVPP